MAQIVLGIGTAHSTQCSMTTDWWVEHGRLDPETTPFEELLRKAPSWMADEIKPEILQQKHTRVQQAIARLGEKIHEVAPDVLVVIGDDQRELFLDDGIPTFAIFMGDEIWDYPADLEKLRPSHRAGWWAFHGDVREAYRCPADLAEHIVEGMNSAEFDVTRFMQQPDGRSLGHAWTFVRRRLVGLDRPQIPMVPIAVNTYYPPNQPSAKRCFAFGRALRAAIESWPADLRVAIVASGGLSHRVIDEELDRRVIGALQTNDVATLEAVPSAKMESGTSETLNWIAAGGALEHLRMTLVDYVAGYRSLAGTGCGMTFATWQSASTQREE